MKQDNTSQKWLKITPNNKYFIIGLNPDHILFLRELFSSRGLQFCPQALEQKLIADSTNGHYQTSLAVANCYDFFAGLPWSKPALVKLISRQFQNVIFLLIKESFETWIPLREQWQKQRVESDNFHIFSVLGFDNRSKTTEKHKLKQEYQDYFAKIEQIFKNSREGLISLNFSELLNNNLYLECQIEETEQTKNQKYPSKNKIFTFFSKKNKNPDKGPHFIIIGSQKAGTTALFDSLSYHPELLPPYVKEIHFFDRDELYFNENKEFYHQYFPDYEIGKKAFEACPSYIYHPECARRLYEYNKNLKLILLVREPASRAFSAWNMYQIFNYDLNYRNDAITIDFATAIKNEIDNLANTSYYNNSQSYIKRGIYYEQLSKYYEYFDPAQILIIENTALKNQFDQTIRKVSDFLEIKNLKLPQLESNVIIYHNIRKEDYQEQISFLKEFYQPYNQKFFDLCGLSFNWS